MSRKALTLASILAVLLVAVQAHADEGNWMIGFSAGAAIPRGDYRRATEDGLIGGVEFDYLATEKLALGLDGFLTRNNMSDLVEADLTAEAGTPVTAKVTMIQGGAHVRYFFNRAVVSPFVLLGLGAYGSNNSFQSASPSPFVYALGRGGRMRFGTRAALGLMYKASNRLAIGVEGAYHAVWTKYGPYVPLPSDADEFISVRAGVSMVTGSRAD